MVSGQLPPEETCPPVTFAVWIKVRISFRVGAGGEPSNCPREENCSFVRVRVWIRISVGVGGKFSSGAVVLEPYLIIIFFEVQKHPWEVFYKRICSEKLSNIHRKTSVLESLSNKVASCQACNIFKKDPNTGVFLRELRNS